MEQVKLEIGTKRTSNPSPSKTTSSNKQKILHQHRKYHLRLANQIQSYIKNQIQNIIDHQVKCLKTKANIQKQLQTKTTQSNYHTINSYDRLTKFRQQQTQKQLKRHKQYIDDKNKKQQRINTIINKKKQIYQQKSTLEQSKVEKVKYNQQQNAKINQKILKNLENSLIHHPASLYKKNRISTSSNISTRIKHSNIQEENLRISTYCKKMKQAENNIINKQILREKNKNSQIKCFIKERQLLQHSKTQKVKQKYDQRMQSFQNNLSKLKSQKNQQLMNKSIAKSKMHQSAIFKKQNMQLSEFSKILTDFENKYNYKKSKLQQREENKKKTLQEKIVLNNLYKIKMQEQKSNHQQQMKAIFAKLQHIKNLRGDQNISQKQKKQLLKFIDKKDSEYKNICEFLSLSKLQYAQKKINEEQQKAKILKMKKPVRSKQQFLN